MQRSAALPAIVVRVVLLDAPRDDGALGSVDHRTGRTQQRMPRIVVGCPVRARVILVPSPV